MSLRQRMHIILFSGALALCPGWAQADALADVITAAQSALQQGDAQRAYTLLAEQEASYAGNVDYDYWFGLSAVRAGKPARATFALERVLSEQPNHAGSRLELATAWLQLGQRDAATEELDQLETLSPPPQAQERIDALNQELNRQARSEKQRRNGAFVGVELG
ncbi:MAG: tetratricopeptide repeat protein, partial [Alcanivoracaceae bacterium]|nr:tetratricopeptide repeat protein [Alcanivoracaceae bacterium]